MDWKIIRMAGEKPDETVFDTLAISCVSQPGKGGPEVRPLLLAMSLPVHRVQGEEGSDEIEVLLTSSGQVAWQQRHDQGVHFRRAARAATCPAP
jgi:hypothetical protein